MMYLGKDAVSLAIRKSANGILESTTTLNTDATSITFNVDYKPYGLLIATNDLTNNTGSPIVIRTCALWTTYSGGQYATGRYVYLRPNGDEDHWTITAGNTYFTYDAVNKTFTSLIPASSGGKYAANHEYHLWYFTIPFDNEGGDT